MSDIHAQPTGRPSVEIVPCEPVQAVVLTPVLKWGFGVLGGLCVAFGVWIGSQVMGLRDSVMVLQERVAQLGKDACNHSAQQERDRSQDARVDGLQRRVEIIEEAHRRIRGRAGRGE